MKLYDLVELARAGFTRAEIIQLAQLGDAQSDEPAQNTAAAQRPDNQFWPNQPAPIAQQSQPEHARQNQDMSALLTAIGELKTTMQQTNLQQAQQPPKQSVDDIVRAMIIDPPSKEV